MTLQIVSQNGKYAIKRIGRFRTTYLEHCYEGAWVGTPNNWCWMDNYKSIEHIYNLLIDRNLRISGGPVTVMKSIDL